MKFHILTVSFFIFSQGLYGSDPREEALFSENTARYPLESSWEDGEPQQGYLEGFFVNITNIFDSLWPLAGEISDQSVGQTAVIEEQAIVAPLTPRKTSFTDEEFRLHLEKLKAEDNLTKIDLNNCNYPLGQLLEELKKNSFPNLWQLNLAGHAFSLEELNELLAGIVALPERKRKVLKLTPKVADDLLYNSVMLGLIKRYQKKDPKLKVLFNVTFSVPDDIDLSFALIPEDCERLHSPNATKIIEALGCGDKVEIEYKGQLFKIK